MMTSTVPWLRSGSWPSPADTPTSPSSTAASRPGLGQNTVSDLLSHRYLCSLSYSLVSFSFSRIACSLWWSMWMEETWCSRFRGPGSSMSLAPVSMLLKSPRPLCSCTVMASSTGKKLQPHKKKKKKKKPQGWVYLSEIIFTVQWLLFIPTLIF